MHAFSLYYMLQIWIMLIDVTSIVTPEGKHHERSTLPAKWSAHDLFHTIAHLLSKHLDHSNKARCPRQPEAKEQDVLGRSWPQGPAAGGPIGFQTKLEMPWYAQRPPKIHPKLQVLQCHAFRFGNLWASKCCAFIPSTPHDWASDWGCRRIFCCLRHVQWQGRHVQRPNALELRHSATKYWGHDVPLLRASQNGYINSESLI